MLKFKFAIAFVLAVLSFGWNGCSDGNNPAQPDPAAPGEPVTIGATTHALVLEPDASPSEQNAAEEFQKYFKACTGSEIPMVESGAKTDRSMIVLGLGPHARSLGVNPGLEQLGDQGFMIRTEAPHIVIAGTPGAGTLYGVHRFLEDHFGVRWLAPGVTRTPAVAEVTVPPTNRIVKPAFTWRHTSYAWPGKDADFKARVADNDGANGEDSPHGFQISHDGRCHSYFRYVSPGEFFDEHPEYFSEIGGVRVREETQLCLTNPDVLELVTERMLQRMAERPQNLQHNFSQMDYYNYCQCGPCTEMNELYGTNGGTQFWFVNQLAERTSQVYPHKHIGTLAYTYTEEPPKGMTMHPNAAVWLCHMYPSCDSHPIAVCPHDAQYKRRAQEWSRICFHLYMWHYITNFTHYYTPFPNFRAMAADLKFYRDIGVEGIYLQGMGNSGGGGEFSLLRPYYGMKLLWDPDQDPETLRREFLQGYYGAAWEPLETYIEMIHAKVEDDNIHMHLYTNPAMGYLTDPIMNEANRLFDEAESVVEADAEMLERVKVARMPLVYAKMHPRNGYKIEDGKIVWQSDLSSLSEMETFFQRMEDHGFKVVREHSGDPDTMMVQYLIMKLTSRIQTMESRHLRVDVVPILAGRALRITHLASGETVTAHNTKKSLFFPFCGGLEDRVGESFPPYGWVEPSLVLCGSSRSVTTLLPTVNGFMILRTMTLDPDAPILHVETRLFNPKESVQTVRLRSHLELDLGDLRATRVRFNNLAGEPVDEDMTRVIQGMREGVHYYLDDTPDGSWTFSGSKGIEVTQRLRNAEVEYTWLYAYPESLNELEVEVWAKRAELAPGESVTLHQEIEIRAVK